MGAHDWIGNLVQNGAIDPIPMTDATRGAVPGEGRRGRHLQRPDLRRAVRPGERRRCTATPPSPRRHRRPGRTCSPPATSCKASEHRVTESSGAAGRSGGRRLPQLSDLHLGRRCGVRHRRGRQLRRQAAASSASPEAIAAMTKIGANGETGTGLLKRSIDADNVVSTLFTDQKAPFMVSGPWNLPAVKKSGVPYEISPAAEVGGRRRARPFIGVQAMYVAAKGKNKAIAQEFATNYFATAGGRQGALRRAAPPAGTEGGLREVRPRPTRTSRRSSRPATNGDSHAVDHRDGRHVRPVGQGARPRSSAAPIRRDDDRHRRRHRGGDRRLTVLPGVAGASVHRLPDAGGSARHRDAVTSSATGGARRSIGDPAFLRVGA